MQITQNTDGTITLTAPVMIPGAKDCDYRNGEPPLTSEQIQQFAESYNKYKFIDHEHGLTRDGNKIGQPVKSFLLTNETNFTLLDGSLKSYPKGTWMVTTKLTDNDAIQTALNGGYTGYSASIFTQSRADEYLESLKSDNSTPLPVACKTVSSTGNSLIKDVPNPVVLSISLTKAPCLHESKFCNINIEDDLMTEEVKSMKSKILDAMGMSEAAEVEALKSEVVDLKTTIEDMKTEFAESLKSMQESFEKTLTDALTPVAEKSEDETEDIEVEIEDQEDATEDEPVEEENDEVEEETEEATDDEPEEEPVAEKGHSKAEPVHDNLQAEKTKRVNIYEFMGRNVDGTRKK